MVEKFATPDTERATYDVFMAVPDADRHEAQHVVAALREHGLTVYVDDGAANAPAADTADEALRQSRLMIPYYSQHFVNQSRCQRALMTAFLAGHQTSDSLKYVAAINPDDPVSSHIVPIEIADARYGVPSNLPRAIQAFENKVTENSNLIGESPVPEPPPWIGGPRGITHSAERYNELWQLHDELHIADYPFIRDGWIKIGRTAIISGAQGTGKTDLAATYAQLFGAQYQGGVYWTSLHNCTPDTKTVRNRYLKELRGIGISIGLQDLRWSGDYLRGCIARYLDAQQAPSLWIIDDVPGSLSESVADRELSFPAERLYTIIISREPLFRTHLISRIALQGFAAETEET